MDLPALAGGTPVRSSYLVFGSPQIGEAEIAEVVDTLRSGWIGTGPKAAAFEQRFSAYVGRKYAMAVNSCTAALHLSLLAAGIGPGDEVITTPLTFAATANAVVHCGARPVFVDVEPDTGNLDPERLAAAVGPRSRALLPVHYAGRACRMEPLVELATERGLSIIEDCAHAIETRRAGRPAGTFGELACYSFYVTKNLVTAEGGMVLCDREDLADRIKILSLHGMTRDAWRRFSDDGYRHYQVVEAGYKYNMTDLQASLGLHQLDRLEANQARRAAIWRRYDRAFAGLPCRLPAPVPAGDRHARHLYTLELDEPALTIDRDTFLQALHRENIGAGVHYLPVHLHPFYRQRFGHRPGEFPRAEQIGRTTVSLPLSPKLSESDVDDVIVAVGRILEHYRR